MLRSTLSHGRAKYQWKPGDMVMRRAHRNIMLVDNSKTIKITIIKYKAKGFWVHEYLK